LPRLRPREARNQDQARTVRRGKPRPYSDENLGYL